MDTLFAAALDFIELRDDQAVFGSSVDDKKYTWGESEEYGSARTIAGSEFVVDRRYWEMLGKPEKLLIGFSNEVGWEEWLGAKPPAVGLWMVAAYVEQ